MKAIAHVCFPAVVCLGLVSLKQSLLYLHVEPRHTHKAQSSPLPARASNATSADRSPVPAFPLCKPKTNFMTRKSGSFSSLLLNRELSFLHSCLVSVTALAAFNYPILYHGTESPELKSSCSSYASHGTNSQPGQGCSKNIHGRARGEGDTGIRSHHIQAPAHPRQRLT